MEVIHSIQKVLSQIFADFGPIYCVMDLTEPLNVFDRHTTSNTSEN